MRVLWRLLTASLLIGLPGAVGSALAQGTPADGASVVIVFDNSGSMWGKIDGDRSNKLTAAQNALTKTLASLRPGTRTGLVTFGRRRGDCGDIEVVAPPEAGDLERITAPLDKLNPKGKGPIVHATKEAARSIGSARPGSVILIHDDPDNCQQDPCAAAAEIRRDQPGVKVHLVSIGLKKEDLSRMACLPEQTGGRLFDVQNAVQLVAAVNEAVAISAGGEAAPSRAPPMPVPATRPGAPTAAATPPAVVSRKPSPPPAQGAPGLYLSAVLAGTGDLVDGDVGWRVSKSIDGNEVTVAETRGVEAMVALPAGAYRVEAKFGLAAAKQTIDVLADKPTPAILTINAGAMRLFARALANGPLIDQVTYTLFDDSGKAASSAAIWIGQDPQAAIGLPAGSYRLQAERGLARAQRSYVVAPSATAVADLALSAGLLTLRAATKEDGEPLTDVLFIIAEDDPDSAQGRREIARSAAPIPDFVLPSGTYTVTLRVGSSEMRERVAVSAGESIRRTMIMGLGKLVIAARLEQGSAASAWREAVTTRVTRRDGDGREVARSTASPYTAELPSGAYRIEIQVGSQNARLVRDVELQAGRATQLSVELPAARVALHLSETFGTGEPVWEVRDDSGRPVWRGNQLDPRLVLAPGRYSVRATVKDRRAERELVLRNGEVRTFDVSPD